MSETIDAIYDGKVFRPEGKINLPPNKHYILIVQNKNAKTDLLNAWDVLDELSGTVDGPNDWASEHDHYLYGTPKKSGKPTND